MANRPIIDHQEKTDFNPTEWEKSMNRSLVSLIVAVFLSFSAFSIRAGTVWEPASNTVQAIDFSNLFGGDTSAIFAIFDDSDAGLNGSHLLLDSVDGNGADTVSVANVGGGNVQFSAEGGSITFAGSAFRVAASFDGGTNWVGDTGYEFVSGDTYNVGFIPPVLEDGLVASKVMTLIDVVPVPEPETFLLMALGMLALLGLRRRA